MIGRVWRYCFKSILTKQSEQWYQNVCTSAHSLLCCFLRLGMTARYNSLLFSKIQNTCTQQIKNAINHIDGAFRRKCRVCIALSSSSDDLQLIRLSPVLCLSLLQLVSIDAMRGSRANWKAAIIPLNCIFSLVPADNLCLNTTYM